MKGLIIIAALLLTGCESSESFEPKGSLRTVVPIFGSHARISRTVLDDGMPCIVYGNVKHGGITCDWNFKTRAKPIKFYTIPGYACDTTEWPGLCSNLGMDQKEYELKNSHLFKVTDNQKGN